MQEIYVLSIKKEYGLNLLNQKALWEYRRKKSKIKLGDKIILYATAPNKEIIGEFIVGGIVTGNPKEIWEKTKEEVCYQRDEVISYLESGDFPIAFKVTKPKKYLRAISLSEISFFRPPMSYCKASSQLISKIRDVTRHSSREFIEMCNPSIGINYSQIDNSFGMGILPSFSKDRHKR